MAHEVAVVFLTCSAQELERHDEENDADARAGEHSAGGDVPRGSDKAGVDGIPVP